MAKYSYKYSGSNAAFVFAGVATLPTGIAIALEADQHKALQKNKFAKHLIDAGELSIEEIAEVGDSKPASGRGKGAQAGKPDDGKGKGDKSKGTDLTIDDVRKALTDLEITFTEDETLEQLQAKLTQATE
ncbi:MULTISPECIES: hypothetical protein [Acinetobacter]|jgi:hypothetical protein|uniref:Uncharacterized protein n=1 Tax=Acinetobacter johnsonii TaxID=40214 RepID=A0AAW6RUI4_ACIJO|nr:MULTISPECIES: hypothetical protein [Acinetobacter]MDG9786773.1 hypothetical protein [Acinetobacter johnsonii]MDG9799450.1 hypothetical protein [Acinetobacter johnsonii]QBK69672.1 hypothetical protein E0Z08_09105 [Acinetobacter johnsonii]